MEPRRFDVKQNVDRMCDFMERIKKEEPTVDLILFPELATSGYECGERFQDLAEVAGVGPSFKRISELCSKLGVYCVFGFPERSAEIAEILYNSAAVIGASGELLGVYRKVHLFDTEKVPFRPGWEYPLFRTELGKFGVMICWDTAFPEVARTYALKGAEFILIPTNWEDPYSRDWDLITQARAFDNTLFVAGANRIGRDDKLSFFGHSRIVDPLGRVVTSLDAPEEGFAVASLDYAVSLKLKTTYYTFLKDRRPDTYEYLTRKY